MTNRDFLIPADPALSTAGPVFRLPFTIASGAATATSGSYTGLVLPIKQIFGFNAGRVTTTSETGTNAIRVRYLITSLALSLPTAATVTLRAHQLTVASDITDATKVANIANYDDTGTLATGGFSVAASTPFILSFNPEGWALINGALTIRTSANMSATAGGVLTYREVL